MLKKKILGSLAIMSAILLGLCGNSFAADKQTTTSNVNGVTANWEYEVNASNQIEALKCKNPAELTGNITVPSSLDGKTVVELGSEAFKGAKQITGVTLPSSVKKMEYGAFRNCANLSNINLGQLEAISFDVFENCPSLTTVTIPKTLITGSSNVGGVFTGTTNLTSVTFEDGLTQIPSGILRNCKGITTVNIPNTVVEINECAFQNSGIEEIIIPSSVKKMEYGAFRNCANLSNINLGQLEAISFDVFENCPSLTTVTIPKTLITGSSNVGGVFTGTTNLTSVTFEDGLTQIPSGILRNCKGITTVNIPNTVVEINECAFQNSGIEEIIIPNSVNDIGYDAFKECGNLEKITILNANAEMGFFLTQPNEDSVFENHNENLTIYCYENSIAAKYAITNNIKYVYLTGTNASGNTTINETTDKGNTKANATNGTKNDTTIATTGKLPRAGLNTIVTITIIAAIAAGIIYKKYDSYKDIK